MTRIIMKLGKEGVFTGHQLVKRGCGEVFFTLFFGAALEMVILVRFFASEKGGHATFIW